MLESIQYTSRCQQIIEVGRWLYDHGWSPATSGNYSTKIDDQHIAITVSGKHKGRLTTDDIMIIDFAGQAFGSDKFPSAEALLHAVIYQEKPIAGAVLHTHSVNATVLSRILKTEPSVVLQGYELQKAFSGVSSHAAGLEIPIFENTQDIADLSKRSRLLLRSCEEFPAYLMRGHGLYTWGVTMDDCLRHIEALEFLFACELEQMRISK